jgi:hypothetical protein
MSEGKPQGKEAIRSKGIGLYTIVSAQAGGVSDALMRALAGQKLDDFKASIETLIDWSKDTAEASLKWTTKQAYENVRASIVRDQKTLMDTWKAGLGLQMGTAFMGLQETYFATPHMVNMLIHSRLDNSVRPKLERYYNSVYAPNIPDTYTAFQLERHLQISKAEYVAYAKENGWSDSLANKLYEVYNTNPDIFFGFSMFKRGLLDEAELKGVFSVNGWDATWFDTLYEALHRRPTFREMTNLADFVPLPDTWITEVLRANGYLDTDIQYILPALRMRPLREETRSVVGRYLWEHQLGRITTDELTSALKLLGLLPKEITLNVLWAELRYADELLDRSENVIEQRVKYGDIITQEAIKTELVNLGRSEEMANVLAELWYWEYIAT